MVFQVYSHLIGVFLQETLVKLVYPVLLGQQVFLALKVFEVHQVHRVRLELQAAVESVEQLELRVPRATKDQ